MADFSIRVGQRVLFKECLGSVAYVGTTQFAAGKWFGVVLDEPKGKNNGSVQGKTYFQCDDNCGVFVRQTQLTPVDADGTPMLQAVATASPQQSSVPTPSRAAKQTSPGDKAKTVTPADKVRSRLPKSGSSGRLSTTPSTPSSSTSSLAAKDSSRLTPLGRNMPSSRSASSQEISRRKTASPATVSDSSSVIDEAAAVSKHSSHTEVSGVCPSVLDSDSPSVGADADSSTLLTKSSPEVAASADQLIELANLRAEVKDLNEKLDTLKAKRLQDRDKLKEGEKIKIQLTQLQEFKAQMLEQQAQLQKELMYARQQTEEAVEARDRVVEDTSDVQETLEMATLDKEMAEEKAEVLQAELDQANERLEELRVDLQLLQEELQQRGDSGELGESSFQCRQLTQQNERLREALIKLRDASAHDKHEMQRLQKDAEATRTTISDLHREKDKYCTMVKRLEEGMVDLQENVDAALGSEKMVEQLTERNLAQEQRIEEMQEHIETLESLVDASEEIAENNREMKLELRQELEAAAAQATQLERQRETAYEMVADHTQTIVKFRELVQRLQEQNDALRADLERHQSHQPAAITAEKIDFQKMFAETKAHAKAIEMDLRKIEVLQASKHVKLLSSFLPDCFLSRGGDHDAILTHLLTSRISMKVETLLGPVREKFPPPPPPVPTSPSTTDSDMVEASDSLQSPVPGSSLSAEQNSFASRLLYLLLTLQGTADQYTFALDAVDVETMKSVSEHYVEMMAHEKCLDFYIQLLRDDQLGENVNLDKLEKVVGYFGSFYSSTLSSAPVHYFNYLTALGKSAAAACTAITADSQRIMSVCGSEESAVALFSWLLSSIDSCAQLVRRLRRQLLHDRSADHLSFSDQVYEELVNVLKQLYRVSAVVNYTAVESTTKSDGQQGGGVIDLVSRAVDLYYGADDDLGAQSVRTSISGVCDALEKFVVALENGEFDFDGSTREKLPTAPLQQRMAAVRAELQESGNLKQRLQNRDEELQHLKLALKLKQEELSEMNVRREMTEKKLSGSTKDADLTIEKLQRKLDDANALLKRKQHEFDETMNHLQADLESVEHERGQLKDKLKQINKKVLIEGLSKSAGATSATSAGGQTGGGGAGESVTVSVSDSPWLLREVDDLRHVVRRQRNQLSELRAQHTQNTLQQLTLPELPLKADNEFTNLESRCSKLQAELSAVDMPLAMPDWKSEASRRHYLAARASRHLQREKLVASYRQLKLDVLQYISRQSEGGRAVTSFAAFPSLPLTQALRCGDSSLAVTLSSGGSPSVCTVTPHEQVTCEVSVNQLQSLHRRLLARAAPVS